MEPDSIQAQRLLEAVDSAQNDEQIEARGGFDLEFPFWMFQQQHVFLEKRIGMEPFFEDQSWKQKIQVNL